MSACIVHISETNISTETGMGRVEYYWREAFIASGFNFIHIGLNEVGKLRHKALFPYKAYKYYKGLHVNPMALIVHEPAAGMFVQEKTPCFVESHGIERRYWENKLNNTIPGLVQSELSLKTKLFYPIWRLRNCDKGLRQAKKILVINSDDKHYVHEKYRRSYDDIYVFKNGATVLSKPTCINKDRFIVLFNGSWIERKGIYILIEAAKILFDQKLPVHYLLIGTGYDESTVLSDWPHYLHEYVKIIPRFKKSQEQEFLQTASVFVLPSYFEGQPLSLLQAMANSKCCITSNCCGQKDLIENNINGFLFEPGNVVELVGNIKKCCLNPDLVNRISRTAGQSVRERDWNTVSKQLVQYVSSNL